jgi:prepilin-type N-terminal cleavage/methylation domain-containing protein
MRGFTLTEILVVIFIIAIIIGLGFFYINPLEIFKEIRDQQRIKDLEVLSSAILNYIKISNEVDLDGENYVLTGKDEENPSIYLSLPFDKATLSFSTITSNDGTIWSIKYNASSTNLKLINGEGWLPINLIEETSIISNLPVDPLNTISQDSKKNYFYSYVFKRSTNEFEINANLESKKFKKGGSNDIVSNDGGSDLEILEVGNNKCLISYGNKTPNLYGTTTTSSCNVYNLQPGVLPGEFSSQDLCFNKNFTNKTNDFYPTRNFIFKDADNNILIFGENNLSATSSFFINKLDRNGKLISSKLLSFNTTSPIYLQTIYQSKDKNFYIAFRINATSTNPGDSLLIKADKFLNNIFWSKYYYGYGSQYPVYIYENPIDQKIELIQQVVYINSFQSLKIDPNNGNLLNDSSFKYQILFGKIYTGVKTIDGGFVLLGDEEDDGSPPLFLSSILIKFDKDNNIQWKAKYLNYGFISSSNDLPDKSIFILNTKDNGFLFNVLYKYNTSTNSKNKILSFIKTNYRGEVEWIKEYNGYYTDINIRDIKEFLNGDFGLIAYIGTSSNLFLFDKDFNLKNSYKFLTAGNDIFSLQKLFIGNNFNLLISNFVDKNPFYSLDILFKKILLNKSLATIGISSDSGVSQSADLSPEENVNKETEKLYLNLIKLKDFDNLYYLKDNMFFVTTASISFSNGTTVITTSDIVPTSNYFTPTPYDITSTISNFDIYSINVLDQCDNYWSKLIRKNIVINDLKRISNGYISAGYKLKGENLSDFWIGKFSTSGELVSSSSLFIGNYNYLTKVIENGDYFVSGYYKKNSNSLPNGYFAEIDSISLGLKSLATTSNVIFNDLINVYSSYILVGAKYENDYSPPKGYVSKYSANSTNIFTEDVDSSFNSVLYDEGYYIYIAGEKYNQGYIRVLDVGDFSKSVIWSNKLYDIYKNMKQSIKKIVFDENKNIIALFNIFDSNLGIYKIGLARISRVTGDIIDSKVVYNDYFYGKDLTITEDGDFLITGYLPLKKNPFSNWSLGLMKIDKNFDLLWVKYFGGYSQEEFSFGSAVVSAYNAGYLIGGYNGSSKQGWLLKVSYNGDCIRCGSLSFKERFIYAFRNILNNILSNIRSILLLLPR